MRHPLSFGLLVATLAVSAARADEEWKFDVLVLKNKERFDGLILDETQEVLRFKYVVRKPGTRTLVFSTTFTRAEIERIDRLDDADRRELTYRLDRLDGRVEREAARMMALRLEAIPWEGNGAAQAYTGKHFTLTSNAREDIVRRVVVRLEEVFEAYTKHLGAPRQPTAATKIILYKTMPEYRAALQGVGLQIQNPAYYDPQRNQIVAASDLERLAEELDKLRQKHDGHLQELRLLEKKLKDHFRGQPPPTMLAQLRQMRRNIDLVNNENECTFDRCNSRLFATLYHEAFHAYLDNFVFPSREMTVPRWLNEGLAQIFETALVETGDLRVGHIDFARLTAVKEAVRHKRLVPVHELLASEEKQFYVAHASDAQAADRFFLTSWALAYYLTFDRKLLGSEALERYVAAMHRGTPRLEAFRDLIAQSPAEFEERFHQFLLNLRPDGTVRMPEKK